MFTWHRCVDELLWSRHLGSKCTNKCLKTTSHCFVSSLERDKGFSIQPKGEHWSWSPEVSLRLLASFFQLLPQHWCQAFCPSLGLHHWSSERGLATWGTGCLLYKPCPGLHTGTGEINPLLLDHDSITWTAAITGDKPSSVGGAGTVGDAWTGLLSTVGEILTSHCIANVHLKQGSPRPVRCCPATICLSYWVHRAQGQTASTADYRTQHQTRQRKRQTHDQHSDWDVILAESGILCERDDTFLWQEKGSDETRGHGVVCDQRKCICPSHWENHA